MATDPVRNFTNKYLITGDNYKKMTVKYYYNQLKNF